MTTDMMSWAVAGVAVLILAHSSGFLGKAWSWLKSVGAPAGIEAVASVAGSVALEAVSTDDLIDFLSKRLEQEQVAAQASAKREALFNALRTAHAQANAEGTHVPKP